MATFVYFTQHLHGSAMAGEDIAVNVDQVQLVRPGGDEQHALLWLAGAEYSIEVRGSVAHTVMVLNSTG